MTLYSRTGCGPCKTVKYMLDKWGVDYEVKDVDEPENEVEWSQYALSVPVLVEGDTVIVGQNIQAIRNLCITLDKLQA